MPYMDEEGRDYSTPPLDQDQLREEINLFSDSVREISENVKKMNVSFDLQYPSTMRIIEVLLSMLFSDYGPMAGRQQEFFWKSNRAQLELIRQAYAQAMNAKLTLPGNQPPPFLR